MTYALSLYDSIPNGSAPIGDITGRVRDWRSIKRNPGGCWRASGKYLGTTREKLQMFINGLGYEIRQSVYSIETWRGPIVEMNYTRGDGVTFRRSLLDVQNAVRVIYSRVGDNLLTNPGGESGAWAAYNGATVTQVLGGWRLAGNYSVRVQVSDSTQRGAILQTGIAVAANTKYQARVPINVVGGAWLLEVDRDDTGAAIASASAGGAQGELVLTATIPDSNAYAGPVSILLITEASGPPNDVYADDANFQALYGRAELAWLEDITSQDEFGRMERVYLREEMTSAAANALAATKLGRYAYPRTDFPDEYELPQLEAIGADDEVTLTLTLAGVFGTANNRYSTVVGSGNASAHVTALANLCEFIAPGAIVDHALDYRIDDSAPMLIGDILKDIFAAGEAAGEQWRMGVWPGGYLLDYEPEPRALRYRYRNGRLLDLNGALIHPALVEPGYMFLDDAPLAPAGALTNVNDDLRWAYIQEVEFIAPDKLRFKTTSPDTEDG